MRICFCALLAANLLLVANPAQAGKGDDIIRKIQAKFKALPELSLSFTLQDPSDSSQVSEKGRIMLRGKDQFRLEAPLQTIICDGKTIWSYNRTENQVILYSATAEGLPLLLPRQLLSDYPQKYRVQSVAEVNLDDYPCYLLALLPKDESDPTRLLQIWVDRQDYFTRRFKLLDYSGGTTQFNFSDYSTGQKMPDSTFQFTPPPTVEVIDMR